MLRTSARSTAALTAILLLAACGSSGNQGSTSASKDGGSESPAQRQAQEQSVVRFANCMRRHGVANFPDPSVDPRAYKDAFTSTSPAFTRAEPACAHLLPAGGQHQSADSAPTHSQLTAELAFARCMRGRGFQRFPDPSTKTGITHAMVAAAGVDVHQHAVLAAADACVSVTHGLLTRARIARFAGGY